MLYDYTQNSGIFQLPFYFTAGNIDEVRSTNPPKFLERFGKAEHNRGGGDDHFLILSIFLLGGRVNKKLE